MEKVNLPQAAALTSPNPVTIVCTKKPDGTTNFATESWWTYLSFNPNMIAYAMAKTSYSGEMVRSNKKVILQLLSRGNVRHAYVDTIHLTLHCNQRGKAFTFQ